MWGCFQLDTETQRRGNKQLKKKKQSVKDDGLFAILESNIHAMEHALNFKKHETIDKFLQ